jgi:hypothetical protein
MLLCALIVKTWAILGRYVSGQCCQAFTGRLIAMTPKLLALSAAGKVNMVGCRRQVPSSQLQLTNG